MVGTDMLAQRACSWAVPFSVLCSKEQCDNNQNYLLIIIEEWNLIIDWDVHLSFSLHHIMGSSTCTRWERDDGFKSYACNTASNFPLPACIFCSNLWSYYCELKQTCLISIFLFIFFLVATVAQKIVATRKKQQLSIGPCKSLPNSPSHSSVCSAQVSAVHVSQVSGWGCGKCFSRYWPYSLGWDTYTMSTAISILSWVSMQWVPLTCSDIQQLTLFQSGMACVQRYTSMHLKPSKTTSLTHTGQLTS